MSFSAYFDRVWIISLPDRSDRRRRVARELQRIGLPLTPGKVEFFDGIRKPEAEGFPSAGYHGCFLSHREVMSRGIEQKAARVLILEDDVVFHPEFAQREGPALEALRQRPDWGVVQFGYLVSEKPSGGGLVPPPRTVIGLHCYAINGPSLPVLRRWFDEALDRPAGHPDGGRMSPDGTLNHFRWAHPQFPAFLYAPMLGQQSNSPSDLGGRRWFDRIPLLSRWMRAARDRLRQEKWDDFPA